VAASNGTVHLHVGTRKSGTTYVQLSLRASRAQLAVDGVAVAATTQDDLPIATGLRHARDARDDAAARVAVDQLLARLEEGRRRGLRRQIVSIEALAELPEPLADQVVDAVRGQGYDVEVVVTARHWGLSIPSEWQQEVKQRGTQPYADFATAVRERRPAATGFLDRHDVPGIARRWGHRVGVESVHVIACPPRNRTSGSLLELFCGTVGIDQATLRTPEGKTVNPSLSLAQAELVRRLNVELGDRMPRRGGAYAAGVRRWLTRHSFSRREREAVLLPEGMAEWCATESRRQLDELVELGVDLVGRPEDLVTDPALVTGPVQPTEAELLQAAVTTLADLVTQRWTESQRHDTT
jgi:hypothetical protein